VLTNGTNTNFPAGSVLQVVQGTTTTSVSSSSNVYADTGLTATITPKSSTNKILVIAHQNGLRKSAANSLNSISIQLLRGATLVSGTAAFTGFTNSALDLIIGSSSIAFLDSPATISSTTYKTQFASGFNTASVIVQDNGTTSTITLMEIAA
jgi:hypothetical protein